MKVCTKPVSLVQMAFCSFEEAHSSIRDLLVASKACSTIKDPVSSSAVHLDAVRSGHASNLYVATSLIDMHASCSNMADGLETFRRIPCHNAASYTALMLGYVQNGQSSQALELFDGVHPTLLDAPCYVAALVACGKLAGYEQGRIIDGMNVRIRSLERAMLIHSQAIHSGQLGSTTDTAEQHEAVSLANTLISVYAKCGSLYDSRLVFDRFPWHNTVSWNALLTGCTDNNKAELALQLFSHMKPELKPDARTFLAAVGALTNLTDDPNVLDKGREFHRQAAESGLLNVFFASALVNFYAKCESVAEARAVFDGMVDRDVVSWTTLVLAYAENGQGAEALKLFSRMEGKGMVPDAWTYVAALRAIADIASKEVVRQVDSCPAVKMKSLDKAFHLHKQAVTSNHAANIFVATSLVDLYAKCGSMLDARKVFDCMHHQSMVSWNALLLGYADNGEAEVTLDLFSCMKAQAFAPEEDVRAYLAALIACAELVTLDIGKGIHARICRNQLDETNTFVANALVDFYSKCGCMFVAQHVFDSIFSTNIVTWSTLIGGYSRHGEAQLVFRLFDSMQMEGMTPDSITLLAVLTACSHAGLVEQGNKYYTAAAKSGSKLDIQHYDCMIDLFGRGNRLDDALQLVKSMPYEPNVITWNSLLGACHKWKNVEIGRLAYESLVKLDGKQASTYLTMAKIYGSLGMWEEQAQVLRSKRDAKPCKALAWTDSDAVVHKFKAGDKTDEEVSVKLQELIVCNMSDPENEEAFSERLVSLCVSEDPNDY